MKRIVPGLVVVLLVVVVGGVAVFVLTREDPPEELSVEPQDGASTDAAAETSRSTGEVPASLDGTWEVVVGGETTAGFRIQEEFTALPDHTAVGRSQAVQGSITIAGSEVSEGDFTVDLTELDFTDDPPSGTVAGRASAMENQGLETSDFPEATFALTVPIEVGADAGDGETVTAEATGALTLHGVTRDVTFAVEALVDGATIRVASAEPVPVVLADYEIEEPKAPFVASVADEGSFEFLLILEPA